MANHVYTYVEVESDNPKVFKKLQEMLAKMGVSAGPEGGVRPGPEVRNDGERTVK